MSIPPQLIRVKRKRVDESPVTFLQFDEGAKRHRSGSNWVYQRKEAGSRSSDNTPVRPSRDVKPVIHISDPKPEPSVDQKCDVIQNATRPSLFPGSGGSTSGPIQADRSRPTEPRRFHISRRMMTAVGTQTPSGGVSKKTRYGPAVFVERSRAKTTTNVSRIPGQSQAHVQESPIVRDQTPSVVTDDTAEGSRLKKPGVKGRGRSPRPEPSGHAPLPVSVQNPHHEDMAKIAADMNDWVMREIGSNLQSMEQERQTERAKFKPKVPSKRYQERHPASATTSLEQQKAADTPMTDVSDMEDDDDWVLEEYVRIPAHAMTANVAEADVGLLVLEGEADSNLFFGPEQDEEDDFDEDDEDENAENYYTADYPEDEVESDDEYGRHPYGYRNGNASDDEEFDNEYYDDNDDMVIEGDNDDATMARIHAYMKRSRAFQ